MWKFLRFNFFLFSRVGCMCICAHMHNGLQGWCWESSLTALPPCSSRKGLSIRPRTCQMINLVGQMALRISSEAETKVGAMTIKHLHGLWTQTPGRACVAKALTTGLSPQPCNLFFFGAAEKLQIIWDHTEIPCGPQPGISITNICRLIRYVSNN